LKALKARLPESIAFGTLRLVLAHRGRQALAGGAAASQAGDAAAASQGGAGGA
jgi:hypothetical protein